MDGETPAALRAMILDLRRQLGISVDGLARAVSVPVGDVVDMEAGNRPLSKAYVDHVFCGLRVMMETTPPTARLQEGWFEFPARSSADGMAPLAALARRVGWWIRTLL